MGDNPFESATPFLERMKNVRGLVRVAQITRQITSTIQAPQRILDIGCGAGVVTCKLLQSYPDTTAILTDPSEEMVASALTTATSTGVRDRCSFFNTSLIEVLTSELAESGDLVICHGVLNWLTEPITTLETIVKRLPKNTTLSLLVGSRYGHILEAVSRGHIADIAAILHTGIIQSDSYPDRTLYLFDPHETKTAIERCGGRVHLHAGVRITTDLLPQVNQYSLEQLTALEEHFESHPSLWHLGDLTHYILTKE